MTNAEWGNDNLTVRTNDPLIVEGVLICGVTGNGVYIDGGGLAGLIEQHRYGEYLADSYYPKVRITVEFLPESDDDAQP